MEKRIIKTTLLKAMKEIRKEYKMEVHSLSRDHCSLCKLYLRQGNSWSRDNCTICPMTIFWGSLTLACMNRECYPIDCEEEWLPEELLAVIEFYKKAINAISSMTTVELNQPHAFNFLREIDKKVSKEYGIEKKNDE